MSEKHQVKTLDKVVVRFSGDSGDGMQLAGNIFTNVSAALGCRVSTFPDYPAEIRAPQGSLSGVSGFQVSVGKDVHTPGDACDVLVAMNPAALKQNIRFLRHGGTVIVDIDSFRPADLRKAQFATDDPFTELGIDDKCLLQVPVTQMTRDALADSGLDNKSMLKCRNIFALGLVCWLFDRPLDEAVAHLSSKFGRKPAILEANKRVLQAGFDYGHNVHASVPTYRIESENPRPGIYTDINGNTATAWGLIMASEKSGLPLFLGSYPITPATDILHELAKRKDLGVKAVQMEDEIAGVCSAIGASFAGNLAVTSTSGPGLALKSEAIGLAVMAELPLVVIDVQRGGPSTGLPTQTEETDLMQALYGRNGESPLCVVAPATPTDCFDMAFQACRIAVEHMTPVILLSDAFIGNGASAWRVPDDADYPAIHAPRVPEELKASGKWQPYSRDPETLVRYWAVPGTEGLAHRIGGLEKDCACGAISTDPANHAKMVEIRREKINRIAADIPELEVLCDADADTLLIGWGGTYGHLHTAAAELCAKGVPTAFAHFRYINPLPANTAEVLRRYKRVIVAELNSGMMADWLQCHFPGINIRRINKVQGQPFLVGELVDAVEKIVAE